MNGVNSPTHVTFASQSRVSDRLTIAFCTYWSFFVRLRNFVKIPYLTCIMSRIQYVHVESLRNETHVDTLRLGPVLCPVRWRDFQREGQLRGVFIGNRTEDSGI